MKRHRKLALLVTATATICTWVSADVITSSYISGSEYEFEIDDMPDFDQVRDTLGVDDDGDPGGMFCVPTSQVNLLGYIATHGYDNAGPDAADWENDEDYDIITLFVALFISIPVIFVDDRGPVVPVGPHKFGIGQIMGEQQRDATLLERCRCIVFIQ